MNRFFLKIAIIFVLISLAGETSAALWKYTTVSVACTDENEDTDTQKEEKGKETVKDKLLQGFSYYESYYKSQPVRSLHLVHFNYTAYLSLPEIPPDQA